MDDTDPNLIQDAEGVVKWFDQKKGFGFIVGPEGQDIFVHYSQITGDGYRVLRDNARVKYDAERGDKGWHATRVDRLDPEVRVRAVKPGIRNPRRTT